MTREEEVRQLESLRECAEDIGLGAEFLESAGEQNRPALTLRMPEDEDGAANEIVCSFLPLEEDKVKFTNYLQLYMEIPGEIDDEMMPSLLVFMHQLNQIFAVGQCFFRFEDMDGSKAVASRVGVRYTLASPVGQDVDEGCFCESVLLLNDAFDFLKYVLDAVKDPQKSKELIQQLQEMLVDTLRESLPRKDEGEGTERR